MNIGISSEVQQILAKIRAFVDEEVIPLERPYLDNGFNALLPALEEARAKAKGLGLWLPQVPREYGGMGLSLLEHGYVSQALGRSPLAVP